MNILIILLTKFKNFIEEGIAYKLPISILLTTISIMLYEKTYLYVFVILFWIFTFYWLLTALWLVVNGWINKFIDKK